MELDEQVYSLSLKKKKDLIILQLAWGNVNVDASWLTFLFIPHKQLTFTAGSKLVKLVKG